MSMLRVVGLWFLLSFSASAIELQGELTQGSLVRGALPPGSSVWLNDQDVSVLPSGEFVIGFARDAELTQQLRWQIPGKDVQHKRLELVKRQYDIQRIDGLKESMVSPPESVLNRIRQDSQKVASARARFDQRDDFMMPFIWPAEGPITGVYGSQRILNGKPKRPHYGVDVGAPTGTKVVAPADGIVTLAEADLYYSGGTIIIDHGLGVNSTFLHLSKVSVEVGQQVSQGALIGEIGATGRATGPHLDWRINWKSMRLDPQLLVVPRQ